MSKLDDVLKELRGEVGGDLIQTSVLGPDGIAIACESTYPDPAFVESMTGRVAMSQSLARKVVEKTKTGTLEDSILSTDKAYVLTRSIGDGSYTIAISVTRKATLGTIRMLLEEYGPKIWDVIPR
jgi:predicted regulator of Ras-like GTPase activity (Roadblock/LC7/MglB family)